MMSNQHWIKYKRFITAQIIFILTSSIDKKEFNCIDGLDVAKDIWTTLWMAHEGSNPV
jgi:hypothetical protein